MRRFELTIFRRHQTKCEFFPGRTYFPTTPAERKADTCKCNIAADGYLQHEENRLTNFALDTNDWTVAHQRSADLIKAGRKPEYGGKTAQPKTIPGEHTIQWAVEQYISYCKRPDSTVGDSTLPEYETFLNSRLLPWCIETGKVMLKELEELNTCRQFSYTWKNLKYPTRKLGGETRKKLIQIFSTFINWCIDSKFGITYNAAAKLYDVRKAAATSTMRLEDATQHREGLTDAEYERVLVALDSYDATTETKRLRAFVELLRWSGMRLSDAMKFCRSELVRNSDDTAWHANFIQWKLRKHGERARVNSAALPDDLADLLLALPHTSEGPNPIPWLKHRTEQFWFDLPYTGPKLKTARQLLERTKMHWYNAIKTLFEKAQKEIPFKQPDAANHHLRHTFAISKLRQTNYNYDLVASWLGHFDPGKTMAIYSRPTGDVKAERERAGLQAMVRERARMEEFRMRSWAAILSTQHTSR